MSNPLPAPNAAPAASAAPLPPAAPVPPAAPQEAVHFLDYWQILYSRKEIVIMVSLLLILVGVVVTTRMPKVYSATAVIEVHRETPNIDLMGGSSVRYDPIYLRTQFEIIKSRPILERVVKELALDQDFGMEYGWKNNYSEKGVTERTVNLLRRQTTLSIYRDTDLIAIEVRLDKPDRPEGEAAKYAANIANTIARVYQERVAEEGRKPILDGISQLENDIRAIERQIAENEDKLASLRVAHGVTVASEQDSGTASIRARVLELTARADETRIKASLAKSRYDRFASLTAENAVAAAPYLVQDQSLAPLLARKNDLELQLAAQTKAGLGPNHPEVQQSHSLLANVDRQIEEKLGAIRAGLRQAWEQEQQEADYYADLLAKTSASEMQISAGVAVEMERLRSDLETLKLRRRDLQNRMDLERIKLEMPKTAVIPREDAVVPSTPLPVSPNFALNVTLSVVAGLFFGVVLAFFVEYLDTTVKTTEDVEKYLQANVIGLIPQKLRSLNDPNARFTHYEVYRVLRMNLKNSRPLAGGKVVIFTSASAGEGKSLNAFNLAWVCAECGEKVLLIDADLYHPRQHRTLGVPLEPGLCNVVVGEAPLDGTILRTEQENLDFLPAGRIASTSVFGLMDTEEMAQVFATERERYDRIIVDAPPMIGVSDTSQLVRLGDGVALIVQHRKYPRALCRRAKERIVSMGGNFIGVILNNVNAAHGSSSYYYENQYYYYYTNDSGERVRRRRRSSSSSGEGDARAHRRHGEEGSEEPRS